MNTSWKPISATHAAAHPLYGIKGWLLFLAFGLLLGPLKELAAINAEAHKAGVALSELLSIDLPQVSLIKVSLSLSALCTAVIYWLLFTKHPKFRSISTWIWIGSYPVVAILGLLNPFEGLGSAIITSLIPWLLSCAVWVTYLNLSQRVRVTFEHSVRVVSPEPMHAPDKSSYSASSFDAVNRSKNIDSSAGLASTNRTSPSGFAMPDFAKANVSDEVLWASALAEFESRNRRQGLWAKSFSDSNGNESLAKARYLANRVHELQKEQQAAQLQQEEAKRQMKDQEKRADKAAMERFYYLLPKGICPNCDSKIPLESKACPRCKALFGSDSTWKPRPLD